MELRTSTPPNLLRDRAEARPRWARTLGVCVLAASFLLATSCAEEEPAARGQGTDNARDDDDEDDDTPTATKDAGKVTMDSGSKPTQPRPLLDAGAVVVDPVVTSPDGSTAPSTPVGDGGPIGVSPGPIVLPEPDVAGPYEVEKEINVGVGFENPPANANDEGDGTGCQRFVESFGETPEMAKAYATLEADYNIELYTMYRPKTFEEGKAYPVVSWANGTCAKVIGYEALLNHVASHGFIVIAAHSRYTGSGKAQLRGIDWLTKQNDTADSPLYKHVDLSKVGVFGHSQGGTSTWTAAADTRVKTSVVLNSTGSGTRPTPTFFVTGDNDILFVPEGARSAAQAQTAAAYLRFHKVPDELNAGHITLMKEPARVYPSVVAWFRYHLLADAVGKAYFVGADCKLCKQPSEFDFYQKGLK